jgi:hypothetical protein
MKAGMIVPIGKVQMPKEHRNLQFPISQKTFGTRAASRANQDAVKAAYGRVAEERANILQSHPGKQESREFPRLIREHYLMFR